MVAGFVTEHQYHPIQAVPSGSATHLAILAGELFGFDMGGNPTVVPQHGAAAGGPIARGTPSLGSGVFGRSFVALEGWAAAFLAAGDDAGCELYDARGDRWQTLPGYPVHEYEGGAAMCATQQVLYAVGGLESPQLAVRSRRYPGPTPALSTLGRLDVRSPAWETLKDCPVRCTNGAVVLWRESLYYVGGWNGAFQTQLLRYDVRAAKWDLPLCHLVPGRSNAACCLDGDTMVLVGGSKDAPSGSPLVRCQLSAVQPRWYEVPVPDVRWAAQLETATSVALDAQLEIGDLFDGPPS